MQTSPGQDVYVVGNKSFLGRWNPKKAMKLKWTDGHVWQKTCDVPVGEDIEFKASW